MKYVYIVFCLYILLPSCTKDNCEGISCINGDCNDGTCACDEGWKGDFCDEVNFNLIGNYTSDKITYFDCDDTQDNGIWPADRLNNFCYPDGDATKCFSFHLELKSDGTFHQFWVDTETSGGITISEQDPSDGTYEIDGEIITLCSSTWSQCEDFKVNAARSGMEWTLPQKSNSTGCRRTYNIIRK